MRYICGTSTLSAYERRYAAAMQELEKTDIWKANYAPPLLVLQRKLGMRPRPPHYLGRKQVVVRSATAFSIFWGTSMWFLMWADMGMPVGIAIVVAALTGLGFGLAMAFAYQRVRRKWGLSIWEEL